MLLHNIGGYEMCTDQLLKYKSHFREFDISYRVYIEFFLSHIQVAQETNLQSITIQTVERIMSRKCNTAAIIELIILDCKTIMSSFRQVSFCFMSRQTNVEAYRLVGIAKHVGSRIWIGHISQPWMLFLVFLFLMFFK